MASQNIFLVLALFHILVLTTASPVIPDEPVAEPPPITTRFLRAALNLTINVQSNGHYQILQNGTTWLQNSATFFKSRGQMCSSVAGKTAPRLHLTNFGSPESGWDNMGEYESVSMTWKLQDCEFESPVTADEPVAEPPPCTNSVVVTSIRAYKMSPMIVFSQNFNHNGLPGTSVNNKNKVSTGFPTFEIGSTPNLGYMSYGGLFLLDTRMGMWKADTEDIQTGLYGGPLVLFDKQQRSMVIGPFSEFMASSIYHNTQSNAVEWGIMGSANSIPKDFVYETAVVFRESVKSAIMDYGQGLLKHHGKTRAATVSDFTSNYLGYWTDNGAYYYYETAPSMNYDETLMAVKKYSDGLNIPYRYFQLDSWWYYKGISDGVKNWTARADIFPKGIQDFYNRLGLPLVAHNRWWSSDTDYAKSNGGKWNFIVEKDAQKAIPQDEGFWNYLLAESKKWGLIVYEQDWLNEEFEDMKATTQNVKVGRTWMNTMSAGASMNDMPIQLCMPMARHLLQSVEMPAVTQSRASDDYQPGNSQWNIGISSIMLHALGLRPYKDNFWTTSVQPDNPYGRKEINPQLQSVVATLSTGPVGPSDMLDHANATLIMRSCNADGKLLQPSRPAMTLSGYIMGQALGQMSSNGVDGIIWSTISEIPFGLSQINFGLILAIEVDQPTMLTPITADFGNDMLPPSMAYSDMDPLNSIVPFDEKTPLKLPLMLAKDFQLWHTTPRMHLGNNTVLLLGELTKWVKVSPDRINDISLTQEAVIVSMTGAPNEKVTMTFMFNTTPIHVTCTIPEDKQVVIEVMNVNQHYCK